MTAVRRCILCTITGRVQGVAFRAATLQMAQRLHLTGWVRNRDDGRVETLASGNIAALDAFRAWLHQGPPYARVSEVDCTEHPPIDDQEFTIRR